MRRTPEFTPALSTRTTHRRGLRGLVLAGLVLTLSSGCEGETAATTGTDLFTSPDVPTPQEDASGQVTPDTTPSDATTSTDLGSDGGDTTTDDVVEPDRTCAPCRGDAPCPDDMTCVTIGDGQFCVAPCGPDGECELGYTCVESPDSALGHCVLETGGCTIDGTPCGDVLDCDDEDPCTTDRCEEGLCAHPPDPCDDGDPCTTNACDPESGCAPTPAPGGTSCDDGDPCTVGDACGTGGCAPGGPKSCDDGLPCTTDTCDADGDCVNTVVAGSCLVDGVCYAEGTGVGSDCRVCQPTVSTTALSPAANGSSCEDGDACTEGDLCAAGACEAGLPVDCDDGDACTAESCAAGFGCVVIPLTGTCDDGDVCTTGDTCTDGACKGSPRDCSDENGPCTVGVCDAAKGGCVESSLDDGTPCDDGDACTTTDACAGATCLGQAVSCDDGLACTLDTCELGECIHEVAETACLVEGVCYEDGTAREGSPCDVCDPDRDREAWSAATGTPCSDGDACTTGDLCQSGTCAPGSAVDCSDESPCTAESCVPAVGCVVIPIPGPCSDGAFCTANDTCVEGECQGTPRSCDELDAACTSGVCDETQDACVATPLPNGTACDDGSACSANDLCAAGSCGGSPVAGCCTADLDCDDGNACTLDRCSATTRTCQNTALPGGTACDDGQFCTSGDACVAGLCKGASPRDCSGVGSSCGTGVCDETGDACIVEPKVDGTPCTADGDACTTDACAAGECVAVPNTAPCDDGDACTFADACSESGCKGTGYSCDDGLPCTADACRGDGQCTHTLSTSSCVIAGACVAAGTLDPQNPCRSCQPNLSTSEYRPVSDGTSCPDDGQACTVDLCSAGTCGHVATLAACDDGDSCTATDRCTATGCRGTAYQCNDGLPCTTDACDGAGGCTTALTSGFCLISGACVPSGAADPASSCRTCQPGTSTAGYSALPSGVPCTDGNPCTENDTCAAAGACTPGAARVCDDLNPCTADTCIPQVGCINVPTTGPCSDGKFCTVDDVCSAGTCSGTPRDCNGASTACATGTCDETQDRCSPTPVADGLTCDDGKACTAGDACAAGKCAGTALDDCCTADVDCDDGDPCTTDACDIATRTCKSTKVAAGSPCDDGAFCTTGDVCGAGGCVGVPRDCAAEAGSCQTGACDEATDACVGTPVEDATPCVADDTACTLDLCVNGVCKAVATGLPCTDGDPCTAADKCTSAGCVGSSYSCSDNRACTVDACDGLGGCTNVLQPGFCTIDGACIPAGATEPSNPCRRCNPDVSTTSWTASPDQTACADDGSACTADYCLGGACAHPATGATCNDGDACTKDDRCATAACAGQPYDCDDDLACTTDTCNGTGGCTNVVVAGQCAIGGACYGAGTIDPNTPCRLCLPSASLTSWTALTAGVPCNDGDPCTTPDGCDGAGACRGKALSCDDQNPCTSDACVNGSCVNTALDGATCSDGNACTIDDRCQGTGCVGTAKSCDDGLTCTTDVCTSAGVCVSSLAAGSCLIGGACVAAGAEDPASSCRRCEPALSTSSFSPVADGTVCDDDDACTAAEQCTTGVCRGVSVGCDDGNPCTTDGCDPTTGCTYGTLTGPCDDGDRCTTGDACDGGGCVGAPVSCSALDGACVVGACAPETGACTAQPKSDGTACNDGQPCTSPDVCQAGTCTGTIAAGCCTSNAQCDDQNPCTTDTCTIATGTCVNQPVAAGAVCDDGRYCTTGDSCAQGSCTGQARDCGSAGGDCQIGVCNEVADRCDAQPKDNGTPCTADGVACTIEVCAAGACTSTGVGAGCDDGNACTRTDTCLATGCVGTAYSCDDGASCTVDSCDGLGGCSNVLDAGACRIGGACVAAGAANPNNACLVCNPAVATGTWVPAASGRPCTDDGVACTNDLCNDAGTCTHPPSGAACDDGVACTKLDVCGAAGCRGETYSCDDGKTCTVDSCNGDGTCGNTVVAGSCFIGGVCYAAGAVNPANPCQTCDPGRATAWSALPGAACDDGVACTTSVCGTNGTCEGTPRVCNDGNVCTTDSCNPATDTCVTAPVSGTVTCSDGNTCTKSDVCTNGTCAGTPYTCDDGKTCTSNVCTGAGGCTYPVSNGFCLISGTCLTDGTVASNTCYTCNSSKSKTSYTASAEGTACTDNSKCTNNDACAPISAGSTNMICRGTTVTCDDQNPCTTDSCTPSFGCVSTANAETCDDGKFCTVNDVCAAGSCGGSARDCSDGNSCTVDTCSEATGACASTTLADGTTCSDGQVCTAGDVCTGGVCGGTPAAGCCTTDAQCTDGNPCTTERCEVSTGTCTQVGFLPVGTACDDGNACSTASECKTTSTGGLTCQGTASLNCSNLNDSCNFGVCNSVRGCERLFKLGFCNDGNACTTGDRCVATPGSNGAPQYGVCTPTGTNYPAELCDGIDQDCDGAIDEGLTPRPLAPTDGVCANNQEACVNGAWTPTAGNVAPSAELCNGLDDDCNGLTDEDSTGAPLTRVCYGGPAPTAGVGLCRTGVETCAGGQWGGCVGQVLPAAEVCTGTTNATDEDCDGLVDEEGGPLRRRDRDRDGYAAPDAVSTTACYPGPDYTVDAPATDCDDRNALVHPGATEPLGGPDMNCDELLSCARDDDGDGVARMPFPTTFRVLVVTAYSGMSSSLFESRQRHHYQWADSLGIPREQVSFTFFGTPFQTYPSFSDFEAVVLDWFGSPTVIPAMSDFALGTTIERVRAEAPSAQIIAFLPQLNGSLYSRTVDALGIPAANLSSASVQGQNVALSVGTFGAAQINLTHQGVPDRPIPIASASYPSSMVKPILPPAGWATLASVHDTRLRAWGLSQGLLPNGGPADQFDGVVSVSGSPDDRSAIIDDGFTRRIVLWPQPTPSTPLPPELSIAAFANGCNGVVTVLSDGSRIFSPSYAACVSLNSAPSLLPNLAELELAGGAAIARFRDGTLAGWGNDGFFNPVPILAGVVDVASAGYAADFNPVALALQRDGTVTVWGKEPQADTFAEFFDGDTVSPAHRLQVEVGADWVYVRTTGGAAPIIVERGGAASPKPSAPLQGLPTWTRAVALSSGGYHALAVLSDYSVFETPYNGGPGQSTPKPTFVKPVVGIGATYYRSYAIEQHGDPVSIASPDLKVVVNGFATCKPAPGFSQVTCTTGVDRDNDGMDDLAELIAAQLLLRPHQPSLVAGPTCDRLDTGSVGVDDLGDCDDGDATAKPGAPDPLDDELRDTNCDGSDGDLSRSLIVDAARGLSAPAGTGSVGAPLSTIGAALDVVEAGTPVDAILLSAGSLGGNNNFTEAPLTVVQSPFVQAAVEVTTPVTIAGGFVYETTYLRYRRLAELPIFSPQYTDEPLRSTIRGGNPVLRVTAPTGAVNLLNLSLDADDGVVVSGAGKRSSIALEVRTSGATVTAERCEFISGKGVVGSTGAAGAAGLAGNPGAAGISGTNGGTGGAGGTAPCSLAAGGNGGAGGLSSNGSSGARGKGPTGDSTGTTSSGGALVTATGSDLDVVGGDGADAANGPAPTEPLSPFAGASGGVFDTTIGDWVANPGRQGITGLHGTGASGGGGGGGAGIRAAAFLTFQYARGGGGGGGGGGGCGGNGGSPGSGGGGSFPVLVLDEGTGVTLEACELVSDTPGAGGTGGNGGNGGNGGLGGSHKSGQVLTAPAGTATGGSSGKGGTGGRGRGGGGGGGGSGGWSCGVMLQTGTVDPTKVVLVAPTLSLAPPAPGGLGGLQAGSTTERSPTGPTGTSANVCSDD